MPGFQIKFSYEKNLLLKETRNVSFEDVLKAIEKNYILDNLEHRDKQKRSNQRILVVKIKNYIYAVPYVIDDQKKTIFLKTIYPSRVLTKRYLAKK